MGAASFQRLSIVSDLHINGVHDPVYFSLLRMLALSQAGDVFVLAGDIFDLFVGNKPVFTKRYKGFMNHLSAAGKRGVDVRYIEGNHDFLLHEAFKGMRGVRVHQQDIELELAGKRFYIAHGDLIDREDFSYQLLRSFFRSLAMKAIVAAVPGKLLDRVGKLSSEASRAARQRRLEEGEPLLPDHLSPAKRARLREVYRKFAAERIAKGDDFIVLGHCHDLDEASVTAGDRAGQYINVGYPPLHRTYLTWKPGEALIRREKLPG